MNHKRRKPRRKVKCAMCTPHRHGNAKSDKKARDLREIARGVIDKHRAALEHLATT